MVKENLIKIAHNNPDALFEGASVLACARVETISDSARGVLVNYSLRFCFFRLFTTRGRDHAV